MHDPTKLEPQNGDFAAYVEGLQQESLTALQAANRHKITLAEMDEALEESKRPSLSALVEALGAMGRRAKTAASNASVPPLNAQPEPKDKTAATRRPNTAFGRFLSTALMLFGGFGFVVASLEGAPEPVRVFSAFALICGLLMSRGVSVEIERGKRRRHR